VSQEARQEDSNKPLHCIKYQSALCPGANAMTSHMHGNLFEINALLL